MKTNTISIAALVVMASVVLTSCIHFEDQGGKKNESPCKYYFGCSTDVIALADIEATYVIGGKSFTDTISKDKMESSRSGGDTDIFMWSKEFEIDPLPTRAAISIRYLPKDLCEVDNEKMYNTYACIAIYVNKCFEMMDTQAMPFYYVRGSRLRDLFDIMDGTPITLDYTIQSKSPFLSTLSVVKNENK